MSEQVTIRVGQRWVSRDKRDHGRTVTVEAVWNGLVVVRGTRKSTLRVDTLRSRYTLIAEPTS